jgi:CheY-like chemotaxis protein
MPPATPGNPDVAPADVNGAVVLVVDDDRAWRLVLETDLRILGYSPLLAADSVEALDRSADQEPDAAIVDLMLPETDGLALVSELRARGRSLPTIFYSAYPISRTENQHPDVVACVSKAAAKADLYTLLPEAIRRKQRRRHSVAP